MRATAVFTTLVILLTVGCTQPANPTATPPPNTASVETGDSATQPTEPIVPDGILSFANG